MAIHKISPHGTNERKRQHSVFLKFISFISADMYVSLFSKRFSVHKFTFIL